MKIDLESKTLTILKDRLMDILNKMLILNAREPSDYYKGEIKSTVGEINKIMVVEGFEKFQLDSERLIEKYRTMELEDKKELKEEN